MQLRELLSTFRDCVKKKYSLRHFSIEMLSATIGVDTASLRQCEKGAMPRSEKDCEKIKVFFDTESLENIPERALENALASFSPDNAPAGIPDTNKTGSELRKQKALGRPPFVEYSIIFVPVAAQAGYSRKYMNPVYIDKLERVFIPGLRYKGDSFRYFEVEGDNMYPTLEEGMHVMAEKVEQENWKYVNNYYIYVIVILSRVLVKRLFKKDNGTLVLISDNEAVYPQEKMPLQDIKELWLVKRKLDWRMAPPKEFKINV